MFLLHWNISLEKLSYICNSVFCFLGSGFVSENISKVLEGQCIGTLFHKDAQSWVIHDEFGARDMAVAARECSRRLQSVSSEERKKILLDVADALEGKESLINVENEADVAAARRAGYDESLISRLTLKPGKASRSLRRVSANHIKRGRIIYFQKLFPAAFENK